MPRAEQQWETWDVRRSLFDNHVSASFEANMEHMYKHFGFYFPDAEYLVDPEGLLKYLVRLCTLQTMELHGRRWHLEVGWLLQPAKTVLVSESDGRLHHSRGRYSCALLPLLPHTTCNVCTRMSTSNICCSSVVAVRASHAWRLERMLF